MNKLTRNYMCVATCEMLLINVYKFLPGCTAFDAHYL